MPRAVIFANGHLPSLEAARQLVHQDDRIIAANGGSQHLLQLGLVPSIIIGDLDSINEQERKHFLDAGVEFIAFDREKDETDLELALKHAVSDACQPILIIGALGGRLDQTLANLSLLGSDDLRDLDVRFDDGTEEVFMINESRPYELHGSPGDLVSLLPWGRPVEGIVTQGLRWELRSDNLHPHKTRGISNVLLNERASLRIRSGLLLLIHLRLFQTLRSV